ncbi:hypothetical protein B484DRAFT_22901, partial [Ochromonadaceae sp. CCMP2298]
MPAAGVGKAAARMKEPNPGIFTLRGGTRDPLLSPGISAHRCQRSNGRVSSLLKAGIPTPQSVYPFCLPFASTMNLPHQDEEIFETVESGCADNHLASHKEGLIDRPLSSELEEPRLDPEAAFAVFNGRLFSSEAAEYSLADTIERRAESPLQRFARLRGELDALKFDLDGMVEGEGQGEGSVWAVLQRETGLLLRGASGLADHKALMLLRANLTAAEHSLLGLVEASTEEGGGKGGSSSG